jgi:hypothetical protein
MELEVIECAAGDVPGCTFVMQRATAHFRQQGCAQIDDSALRLESVLSLWERDVADIPHEFGEFSKAVASATTIDVEHASQCSPCETLGKARGHVRHGECSDALSHATTEIALCKPASNNHSKVLLMSIKTLLSVSAAMATLATASVTAYADDHPYTEGPVVNVAKIRTVDGKFDDYMKWLDTTWKREQEAGKKSGWVVSYEVLTVEPRTPDDPDVILRITYKNWAALDGFAAKADAVAKEVEGSVTAANKSESDRSTIRRVLGSSTMQVLILK